jgi:hypothetical protein
MAILETIRRLLGGTTKPSDPTPLAPTQTVQIAMPPSKAPAFVPKSPWDIGKMTRKDLEEYLHTEETRADTARKVSEGISTQIDELLAHTIRKIEGTEYVSSYDLQKYGRRLCCPETGIDTYLWHSQPILAVNWRPDQEAGAELRVAEIKVLA